MTKKKKAPKTMEELTKHFEEFSKQNPIKQGEFDKNLSKIIKKRKKA